ncbi:hypothetical protein QNH37_25380 [Peribacillus simplex]|nr:hypothetical protein [Peribacillus simplex]WHY97223.1 hypothetical protein QNH37_25380 [Peribacillus simplex]
MGRAPSRNGGNLAVTDPPKGFPVPEMPDMPNEHSPGLSDLNNKKRRRTHHSVFASFFNY